MPKAGHRDPVMNPLSSNYAVVKMNGVTVNTADDHEIDVASTKYSMAAKKYVN